MRRSLETTTSVKDDSDTLTADGLLKMWAEIQPPKTYVTQWLEWDSYLIGPTKDIAGRWQPRTIVIGRRAANYIKWRDAWVRSLEEQTPLKRGVKV